MARLKRFAGVTLIWLVATSLPAAVTSIGSVTNVTLAVDAGNGNTNAVFWISNGGVAQITPFAPDLVRVRYYFTALWPKEEPMIAKASNQWQAVSTTFTDQGGTYLVRTPQLDVVVNKNPFRVDFKDRNAGYSLLQDPTSQPSIQFDPDYNYTGQSGWTSGGYKLKATKILPANQAIFGLGEFGGPMNRRNRELECWNQGTYNWNEFQNPTYMNIPFFYGVQPAGAGNPAFVYGILFNNPCRPLFSFNSTKSGADRYSFEAGDGQLDYFFFGGGSDHSMAGVIDRFSELTGRPTFLPKWGLGHHLSRFSYDNQDWVQYVASNATSNDVPLDAVYLDIDYMQYGNLGDGNIRQLTMKGGASNTGFPNPAGMISYCNNHGVKVVPLIEPWLQPNDTTLYNDANANFHFIKNNNNSTTTANIYVGPVSWFDYTSTAMWSWWQGKILNWFNSYNTGNPSFAGIWNDLTEPEGGDAIPHNGLLWNDGRYGSSNSDSRRFWSNERNYFGLRCAGQSYATMLAKNPGKRPFVLSRSGNAGLQRHAVSWSGDTGATWTHQRTTIRYGMSAMISGAGWYGHDVGGFIGDPGEELLVRSYEWNALTPFFRNHANKGSADREPWRTSFSATGRNHMRNIIKFRYQLMPYLYTLAYNFTQTGEPMNTPPVFKFFPDNNTHNLNDYEFMVGDSLFAAPVYDPSASTRQVYLPYAPGTAWYYYPSNTRYTGGQTVNVSAPVGTLPLFVRSGAILPMGPAMQHTDQFTPGFLDIRCWPEGTSSFTMFEDAGDGWGYTNASGRALTTFTSTRSGTNWQFIVSARQGDFNPGRNTYYIYAMNPQNVQSVKLNGSTLPQLPNTADPAPQGWTMTGGSLWIKIPDTGTQQTVDVHWTGIAPDGSGGAEIGLPGNWNGWTDIAKPWALDFVDAPATPGAGKWYTNTIHVAASGGDVTAGTYQFKIRADHSWGTNWGFNVAGNAVIDGLTTLPPNGTTNVAITLQNDAYYSFRIINPTFGNNLTLAVMKTAAHPVTLQLTGVSPVFPKGTEPVTVSITTSAPRSPEENIYVRWTTNNWTSSQFATATGAGTSYSAILPEIPNGTAVRYYVMSSTTTTGTGLSHSTADALTLNLDANSGQNFTYTPSNMPWPGFGYPSDPAANIHHWMEEAVVGNGHMTVMLDANGTLYDFYFPTAGQRSGGGTANEGYRGPQEWPNTCSLDRQANGQMNLIAAMAGIAIPTGFSNQVYWLKNANGTDYVEVGQRWVSDDVDVVLTSNRLNVAGNDIKVVQYDFVPAESALPVVSNGSRTNKAVHVKRFILTNNEATERTINFYWDANFNVKGDNAYDEMFWDTTGGRNMLVVRDMAGRLVNGGWCDPNGYGGTAATEYDPSGYGNWSKSNSVYFATVMKLVTNAVTGTGTAADGSWRDHTATDNQEGWIGKRITLPAGESVEVNVLTVGSWDSFAGATGTHDFWGVPLVDWFYTNNMAAVQAATESYWSNWVNSGVTIDFPDDEYDRLFKRSLIISKLHADPVGGGIIAGMHNGAYPFVWPRDGIYAAITFDRTGHSDEARAFYRWLNSVERPTESWGPGFFYQKYTTDGKPVWRTPQVDETAGVPWGLLYHYLVTGDGAFLSNNWQLAYTSARAASEDSTADPQLFFHDVNRRVSSMNIWEDQFGEFLYSNASVVRGLRDAATIAAMVGSNSWATEFGNRAHDIHTNGIIPRLDARTETSDISHFGLVYPFEVFTPVDPRMTNMVEWLHGRQTAGGFTGAEGNLVESDPETAGWLRRYNHKTVSAPIPNELDTYWNGGPWTLANAWYGMYYARWQDHLPGKSLVTTNKVMLDHILAKLGPMGLAGEQIAVNSSEQKYPGFWLQTAWPNVWESHATMLDQMMMFLDYRPLTNNTCAFAPKLPAGWQTVKFNNLAYQSHRFNVTISDTDLPGQHRTRADFLKLTTGSFNVDIHLRIPAGITPTLVITNNGYYMPAPGDFDLVTGRVRVQMPLDAGLGQQTIAVAWDVPGGDASDSDGDGLADSLELVLGSNPLRTDTDADGMSDGFEYLYFGTATGASAADDSDGDGQTNYAESMAGTNPLAASDALRILAMVRQPNGDILVTGTSLTGKKYALLAAPGMSAPFAAISGTNIAVGATIQFTDTTAGETTKLYKIQLVP